MTTSTSSNFKNFDGSISVFTYMSYVNKSTTAEELSDSRLESNIQSVFQNNMSLMALHTRLADLILDKVQSRILSQPNVVQELERKGYDAQAKARDYETEVVNALAAKAGKIQSIVSSFQGGQSTQEQNLSEHNQEGSLCNVG